MVDASNTADDIITLYLCCYIVEGNEAEVIVYNTGSNSYSSITTTAVDDVQDQVVSAFEQVFSSQMSYYGIQFVDGINDSYNSDDVDNWPTPPDKMISYAD